MTKEKETNSSYWEAMFCGEIIETHSLNKNTVIFLVRDGDEYRIHKASTVGLSEVRLSVLVGNGKRNIKDLETAKDVFEHMYMGGHLRDFIYGP